mmetsp:Transcript_3843/g.4454  ORF Transcript_3843/g.4454 Transcript_3843/m.4454 type:complete len:155 (-) Transcript_3843:149-613(-)|eukprot:CAMPEP_0205806784 /NCGR_PEP_ID=MMETSP0205-20121125/10420_1 /ASSEMBLY_ACC=CAM_ASM_000278 /TAXON_ID=36767 /ORGANISM="Euplotes focardii, Strain TN1" /LENGTH=154 /DNA_ID=CAMNT_0053080173 /DNA_START=110 /DNA_END=574 /DNA_ORIENTATION=+
MEGNAKDYKKKILEVAMPKSEEDEHLSKQKEYLEMVNEYKDQIKKCQMKLEVPSEEKDEEDLIFTDGKIDYNKNNSEQVISHGLKTQSKGIDVAERMVKRIAEADDMANDQLVELDRQEEVLLRINEANMEIESDMKRAQKYLKYFARTYMQDK